MGEPPLEGVVWADSDGFGCQRNEITAQNVCSIDDIPHSNGDVVSHQWCEACPGRRDDRTPGDSGDWRTGRDT